MSGHPYYLISADKLHLAREFFEEKLADIAIRWWGKRATVEIHRVEDAEILVSTLPIRRVVGSCENFFAVLGSDKAWSCVVEQWLHCGVERSSPMAGWLELRYISELFRAIFGVPLSSDSVLPDFKVDARPGRGQLLLTVRIEGIAQNYLFPPSILAGIKTESTNTKGAALTQAVTVLGNAEVEFEARLSSVKLSVSELMSLAPGDFLSLQDDLSGTLMLIGKNIDLTMLAVLGKKNDYKAARVASITEPS